MTNKMVNLSEVELYQNNSKIIIEDDLADVAKSGSYNDLTDKPEHVAAQNVPIIELTYDMLDGNQGFLISNTTAITNLTDDSIPIIRLQLDSSLSQLFAINEVYMLRCSHTEEWVVFRASHPTLLNAGTLGTIDFTGIYYNKSNNYLSFAITSVATHTKRSATLTSAGWVNKVQTVAITGLRVSSDTTQEARVIWLDPDVFATAKPTKYKCMTAGQLEITLSGDAPTTNTNIVVVMQEV